MIDDKHFTRAKLRDPSNIADMLGRLLDASPAQRDTALICAANLLREYDDLLADLCDECRVNPHTDDDQRLCRECAREAGELARDLAEAADDDRAHAWADRERVCDD